VEIGVIQSLESIKKEKEESGKEMSMRGCDGTERVKYNVD
jgi:hypothetical protein